VYLSRYKGKPVTVVGKVLRAGGPSATLEASDGGEVLVALREGQSVTETGSFVEVLGTVQEDLSILAERVAPFGKAFNMENYNKLVVIAHERVPELFIE
jgi:replication factor A3